MTTPSAANPDDSPAPLAIALAFAAVYLSWGTTYLASKIALMYEGYPPALFGGVRLTCAGLILLGLQFARGMPLRVSLRVFGQLLLMSWCLFLTANWLMNWGQSRVPSGVAAVIGASTPLWMGVIGIFWASTERLHPRGWIGLVVGMFGVLTLFLPRLLDQDSAVNTFHPFLIVGSCIFWSIGSLYSRQRSLPLPHLTSAGYQMLLGGGSQIVLGVCLGELHQLPGHITPRAAGCFLYLLVFGSLVGFVAFNWLLGHVSAAKVGTYAYVNPVIAILVGRVVDDEPLTTWLLAGIAVILAGVYLVRSDHAPTTDIDTTLD
jgi:drug/metabolite transporter (DMT)-like permease